MSYFKGVKCIRCGRPLGDDPFYEGCPACKAEGVGVNFTTTYDLTGAKLPGQNGQPGLFRWREFYPLPDDAVPVSIGEGNTPLLKLERLGEKLGAPVTTRPEARYAGALGAALMALELE